MLFVVDCILNCGVTSIETRWVVSVFGLDFCWDYRWVLVGPRPMIGQTRSLVSAVVQRLDEAKRRTERRIAESEVNRNSPVDFACTR